MTKTAIQKGDELIEKFCKYAHTDWSNLHGYDPVSQLSNAKTCAVICVEQVIESIDPRTAKVILEYWQSVLTYLKNK